MLIVVFYFICFFIGQMETSGIFVMTKSTKSVWNLKAWNTRLSDTDLLFQTSRELNVSPPWNAPKWVWALAWKIHKSMLPWLHKFDECSPKDSFVNLYVLWWKAIAGNCWGSKLFDGNIAFDLLPDITRRIVSFPLCWLYPRLHHQNVALRTSYLDQALSKTLARNETATVIILGGGFDTRSLRLSRQFPLTKFHEIDLAAVVEQKLCMLNRYLTRRPSGYVPQLHKADLNNLEEVHSRFNQIMQSDNLKLAIDNPSFRPRRIVFIVEAVLLYLDQTKVMPLLDSCVRTACQSSSEVALIFADRFPGVALNDDDKESERYAVERLLLGVGLKLEDWLMKPGKARHMGVAGLIDAERPTGLTEIAND